METIERRISTSEAGRVLNLSTEQVRQLTLAGKIDAIKIEPNGYRAYRLADVERLKAEREAKAGAK